MSDNITAQYFLTLFEEFTGTKKAKIQAYLDIATTRVPERVWGANTKYATALLTAHMLTFTGPQGNGAGGGAVSQEAVGDLSRAFASVFDTERGDALLCMTGYGAQFVQLRKETIVPGMTTRGAAGVPFRRC